MIETTKERARMDTTRLQGRRFARWAVPAGMAALCTSVVLGMGAAGGDATAPTGSGASGSVASISGTTMEVQSASEGQTTVSWTPTTTFSETATETLSAVAVGDCLTVTGTPSKKSKTTVAARSITISTATSSGTRATGGGGAGGFGAGGGRGGFGGGGFGRGAGGGAGGAGGAGGGRSGG